MNILLVTRGSQGDVYPYLGLGTALMKQGHTITLSLPRLFERHAQDAGIPYVLQAFDDIAGMVEGKPDTKALLEWTNRVIQSQFEELPPLLDKHDLLIAANTEFAAPSVAEWCGKPIFRTAYGPFIPGKKIPPPVMPWLKPKPWIPPALLWKALNAGLNLMCRKTLNTHRAARNMPLIADQGEHAPANAVNYLMYSSFLGEIDPQWKYRWAIGGYCFNDNLPYNQGLLDELLAFIKKDDKPTIFFTLGSCNAAQRDKFAQKLFAICRERGYKLVVGCGWWKVGSHLHKEGNLFLLDQVIPHCRVFPFCDAIIHHGGSGTTHSAARAGKPQMVAPLLIDQHYWGQRVTGLGLGPSSIRITISKGALEGKIRDLLDNPAYKTNASTLGEKIRAERGIENFLEYIAAPPGGTPGGKPVGRSPV
ncbi:MAG: glycosyltransferase [Treponema sp.]|jgi:UDP:flavonoid glycosyltransferase YjiC (YdhE family)|nr:glycosyltransferase [Treponema sp.]